MLWPQGLDGRFDGVSALIMLAAALALLRFQRHVIEVIVVAALVGLAATLAWPPLLAAG